MKRFLIFILAAVGAAAAQKINLAVVDLERVKKEYLDYRDALNQLRQYRMEKSRVLDSLRREIDSLKRVYQEQLPMLTDEGRLLLEQRISEMEQEYKRQALRIARDIEQKTRTTLEPYINRIYSVIDSIARKQGIDMVINTSQSREVILYYKPQQDITDVVISELNRTYASLVGRVKIQYMSVFPFKLLTRSSKTQEIARTLQNIAGEEINRYSQFNLVPISPVLSMINPDNPDLNNIKKAVDILKLDAFIWGQVDYKDDQVIFKITLYDSEGNIIDSRGDRTEDKREVWEPIARSYIRDMLNKYKQKLEQGG